MTLVGASPHRAPELAAEMDVASVRADFPALDQEIHGRPLVYLDNAATAFKPQAVIDAVTRSLARDSANVHRGVHTLSARATEQYEGARETARRFFGARETAEVIFVSGATEAINLVAYSWGRGHVGRDDEVLVTGLEHHSNIVPWQVLCDGVGASLKVVPVQDDGDVTLEAFSSALTSRTRLVAVAHASNALGTVLPIEQIVRLAHERGAAVLVDGAQGAPHLSVDVERIGCDFYAASAHKIYGPTGVGVLYARRARLEEMIPYRTGGDMIRSVTFAKTLYAELPHRFEAGTPNVAGVVGFEAALRYVEAIGVEALGTHEQELLGFGTKLLEGMPGVRIIGTAPRKIGVLSFVVDGIHPHDLGTILDTEGVAIRTGHHCAQPLMERFGVPATARVSLGLYNTRDELRAFADALAKAQEIFG